MKVILRISFLFLNNIDVKFTKQSKKLTWRFYTTTKVLSTTNRIELINKKEFAKTILDKNLETFIVYISALEGLTIYFF